MPTLSEVQTLLSPYAGANNTFLTRLNLVRARLIQSTKGPVPREQIVMSVYSDANGNSIVTLPRGYKSILAGAFRSANVLCTGRPLGVVNAVSEFDKMGLGYGGLTDNFQEVAGKFCVYQEWSTPMRLRFKFEVSESAGTIYVSGTLSGEDVWALNTATWEKREAVAFSGTTAVTTTKYFDAYKLAIKKPITTGRVTVYAVDDDGVETAVGVYEPAETLPRWKRYKVPACEDVSPLESSIPVTVTQFYTRAELDAMFADSGTISVSSAGTHDLVYAAYFLRIVRITAAAGSYTHTFTLDNSTVKSGGTLRVRLEMAAGTEVVSFYDNSLAGTLLQTVTGDSSNAQYMTLVFSYDSANWHFEGIEVV